MRAPFVDHLALEVRDLAAVAFGPEGSEDFAISEGEPAAPIHVASLDPDGDNVEAVCHTGPPARE